ncbi:MAG: hypothetical protein CVV53_08820 [Spirochaetae bacterium HGW-Spirochaetae-9]|nr:MAG: hypothetical protein CVV53_08820 [Spirochaetae bacterium HGW-Spirochaetae-9]
MALIVQKFGGTSLADPTAREMLAKKVGAARDAGDEIVLVVSAMGRRGDPYATDTLLELLGEFSGGTGTAAGTDGLTSDLLASCGEVISACVIASLLNSRGIMAVPMTAHSAGIAAEGPFGDAAPAAIDPARLRAVLAAGKVPVVTGFQGVEAAGNILTLGRGGSDTSAVAIGAALKADFVDIYKDVPGVAKADPRLVKGVPFMKFLDYDSMFRLANHGARVLHDKSALLAKASGLKMRVRSTFDDGEGTLIGPVSQGAAAPDFLGLATCSGPENKLRVTAVFSVAAGAKGVVLARESARTIGLDAIELDCDDPWAVAYLCPRETSAVFAQKLFEALN